MKYDLHVHTNYSDGLHSPKEVVDNAIRKGLDGIAITDHDTILGIKEALEYSKNFSNFNVIPGIELSCVYEEEEIHILGYFIDLENEKILSTTRDLRDHRKTRVKKMVHKLNDLNIDIKFEEIQRENDKDFVGRVAIARELIKNKYVSNIQEAFNKYLNPGRPGYVERYKLTVEDGIGLIRQAGGIPVLAHPGLLKDKYLVQYCVRKGIEGIESVHSKHTPKQTKMFKEIASKHKLISTGGSDCHGEMVNGHNLLGEYYVDLNLIPQMKERIE